MKYSPSETFLQNTGTRFRAMVGFWFSVASTPSITPIIGSPNVSVSYIGESAMVSALTSLFDADFEFKYLQ